MARARLERRVISALLPFSIVWFALGCGPRAEPIAVGVHELHIGQHVIEVEIVDNPSTRKTGLSYREKLGENHGMLFVFPRANEWSFWMKNTLIPLDLAYIEDDGTISDIQHMAVEHEEGNGTVPSYKTYVSAKPVHYALEVNAGWFESHHVSAGDRFTGLPAWTTAK